MAAAKIPTPTTTGQPDAAMRDDIRALLQFLADNPDPDLDDRRAAKGIVIWGAIGLLAWWALIGWIIAGWLLP